MLESSEPHFKHRAMVVPKPKAQPEVPELNAEDQPSKSRISWARLLKRVFNIDVETCHQCGSKMKIIAAIEDPQVIKKILTHLGLPAEAQVDINACVSAQSTATRCCGNPQSCAGTLPANDQRNLQQMLQGVNQQAAQGQSLSEYCAQMRTTTNQGSGINNYLSRICYGQMTSCTSTCSSYMQKYQALAGNCLGCASQQIYTNAYSQLRSYYESCNGL